jgi:hypothetical protein
MLRQFLLIFAVFAVAVVSTLEPQLPWWRVHSPYLSHGIFLLVYFLSFVTVVQGLRLDRQVRDTDEMEKRNRRLEERISVLRGKLEGTAA